MTRRTRDIIYGVVIMASCIANYIYANTVTQNVVTLFLAKPDAYLKMWLIVLAFLAVLLIVRALRKNDQEKALPIFTKMAIFTCAVFAAFLLILPKLGYTISAFLFLSVVTITYGLNMGNPKMEKKKFILYIVKLLIFAAVMTMATELLFRKVLLVRLPSFKLW